ncbi:Tectonin beta-propeller repeat-containing protein 1 [Hondaea fermentalgiana]|uniref:Tectonin beta-propeller repeat-containing protein 1 n=1 Tax=Hondaea fermentalgiana TaxID=2315210 RepID=A0A2R5GFA9_9STRA|nr:Tectonin beta-propeller repeat-containing protein 1 [Hondaea fermentalgiana]|eukprot:GBG26534.1 Tectonin beta-propeller repeat-containing protein 1 [Hondaea fermentalgiana]
MLARLVAEAAGRYLEDVRHESVRVSFSDGGACVVQNASVRPSAWRDLGLPFEVESAKFAELRMGVGWSWRGFETSASFHVDGLTIVVRPFASIEEARKAALVRKRAQVQTRVLHDLPNARDSQAWAARLLTRMLETASVTVTNLSVCFAEPAPAPAVHMRVREIQIINLPRADATVQVDATANHPTTGAPSIIVDLDCPDGIVSPQLSTEMLELLLRLGRRWTAFMDGDFTAAVHVADSLLLQTANDTTLQVDDSVQDAQASPRSAKDLWRIAFDRVSQLLREHRRWTSSRTEDQEMRTRRTNIYTDALRRGVQDGPWMDAFVANCPLDLLVQAHLEAHLEPRKRLQQTNTSANSQSLATDASECDEKKQPSQNFKDPSHAESGWAGWLRTFLPPDEDASQEPNGVNHDAKDHHHQQQQQEQEDETATYRCWVTFSAAHARINLVDDHGFPICSFSGSPSLVLRQDASASNVSAAVNQLRLIVGEKDILHVLDASQLNSATKSTPVAHAPLLSPAANDASSSSHENAISHGSVIFFDSPQDHADAPLRPSENSNDDVHDDDGDDDEFHDAASAYSEESDSRDLKNQHSASVSPQDFVPLQRSKSDDILMGHAPLRIMSKKAIDDPKHASSITIVLEPTEVEWEPQAFRGLAAFANAVSSAIGVSHTSSAGILLSSLREHANVRIRFGAPRIRFDAKTTLSLGALAVSTQPREKAQDSPESQNGQKEMDPAIDIAFQGAELLRNGRAVLGPIHVHGTLHSNPEHGKQVDLRIHGRGGCSPTSQAPEPDAVIDEDLCSFIAKILRDISEGGKLHASSIHAAESRALVPSSPTLGWRTSDAPLDSNPLAHLELHCDALRVDLKNKDRSVFSMSMDEAKGSLSLFDLKRFQINEANLQLCGISCKHPNGRALLAQCSVHASYGAAMRHLDVSTADRISLAWVPPAMADAWATLQYLGITEEIMHEVVASSLISSRSFHREGQYQDFPKSFLERSAAFASRRHKRAHSLAVNFSKGCALTLFKNWEPLAKVAVDHIHLDVRTAQGNGRVPKVACALNTCTLYNLRAAPGLLREIVSVDTVQIDSLGPSATSNQRIKVRVGSTDAIFWQPFITEWIDYATTGIIDLFAFSASENVLSTSQSDWIHTTLCVGPTLLRIPSDAHGTRSLSLRLEATDVENSIHRDNDKDVFAIRWTGIRLEATSGACILEHKLVSLTLERSFAESTSLLCADLSNFHFNILEDGFDDIISCLRDNLLNQQSVLTALLRVKRSQTNHHLHPGSESPSSNGEENGNESEHGEHGHKLLRHEPGPVSGIKYWRNWIETKSKPQRTNITVSAISARLLNRIVVSLDRFEAITLTRFVPAANSFLFENEYALHGLEISVAGMPLIRSVSRMDASELLHKSPAETTNEASLRLKHDPERNSYLASLALDNFALMVGPEAPDHTLIQQLHKSLQWHQDDASSPDVADVALSDAPPEHAGQEVHLELEMTGARFGLADLAGNRFEALLDSIGHATTTTLTHGESSRIDRGTLHVDLSAALTDGQHDRKTNVSTTTSDVSSDPMGMTMTASMLDAMTAISDDEGGDMDDENDPLSGGHGSGLKHAAPLLLRPCSMKIFWDMIDRASAADVLTQQIRAELTSKLRVELSSGQSLALVALLSNLADAFVHSAQRGVKSRQHLPNTPPSFSPVDAREEPLAYEAVFQMAPLGLKLGPCTTSGQDCGPLLEVRGFAKQCEETITLKVAPGDMLVSVNGADLTSASHTLDTAKQALRDAEWPRRIGFLRSKPTRALIADPLQFRPLSSAIWTCRNCKSAQPITRRDHSAAFEETCLRCGAVHIQLSTEADDGAGEGTIVHDEVYENQRFYLLVGWSPQLLPTDPYPWSDLAGRTLRQLDAHAPLPESAVPGAKWYWVDDWTVDEARCHTTKSSPSSLPSCISSGTSRLLPRRLAGNLCLAAEAFNVGLLDWEPIIEPWAFAFEAQHEASSWNLTLMGLSRLQVNVGLSIADALAQLPSWGPLNDASSERRDCSCYPKFRRARVPLLALENRSGVTITAAPAGNPSAEFDVDPGAKIAAMQLLGSDSAASDLWHSIGQERGVTDEAVSLRFFGGWKALERISLRQLMHNGEIVAHKLQQATGPETGSVLLRVDVGPDGERIIHVESVFHIVNECDFALSLRLEDPGGQGALMIDPCKPSASAELPLVKNLELRMLLLGVLGESPRSGFVLNLAHLSSSALKLARANLAKAVSPPGILLEQNITELAPGKHVLIDIHAEAIKESKSSSSSLARRYVACKITIATRPPRTVRNALDFAIEVRAEQNGTLVHEISPGNTAALYHLDEVALSFRIPAISSTWSAWVKVAALAQRGADTFDLDDCHGRTVQVPVSFRARRVTVGPALHLEDLTWGLGLQVGLVDASLGRSRAIPGQAATDSIAVAEFQRWLPMQGWKPPSLPGDPSPWAFHPENSVASATDLTEVPLEPGWAWAEPSWRCDTASHDWEYATDFQAHRWSLVRGKLDCARRRIWRRACVRDVPVSQVLLGPISTKPPKGRRQGAGTEETYDDLDDGNDLYDIDAEDDRVFNATAAREYDQSKTTHQGSEAYRHALNSDKPAPPSAKHAVQLVLRLSGQTSWSAPIALVPGTWNPVEVADELSDTVVSLMVQVPVLMHRERIMIWNQFAIRSRLENDPIYLVSTHRHVCPTEVPDPSRSTKVQPGETIRRFHWDQHESGRLLRVGRAVCLGDTGMQDILWSGPIDPSVLDDMVLMLRDPRGVGRALVHVSIREDSISRAILVDFGESVRDTPQAPYRIENRTLYELECRQLSKYSEALAPLVVKDRRVCLFGFESATGDTEGRIHIRAVNESGKPVEAVVHLLGDVNAQQKELEPVDTPENRIVVRVFAEGATRVICVAHAWAVVEAPPYVDERVVVSARCELQGGVTLSLTGMHRELLAVHAEGLSVSGAETDILRTVDFRLASLQMDDADPSTRVPVMLHQGPVHVVAATYVRFPRRVKLLSVRVFPLALHLAKQQIRALSQFYEVLCARTHRRQRRRWQLEKESERNLLGKAQASQAGGTSKHRAQISQNASDRAPISFDVIHVHAMSARVNLTSSATTKSLPLTDLMRRRAGSEAFVRKRASAPVSALEVVGAAIARVTDLDDVQLPYWAVALGHLLRSDLRDHDVFFAELVLHHSTVYEFESSAIAQHYIAQLAKGLASTALVGSGLFRGPIHFARNLSMGMSGVMARGPRSSLEDGASGLVAGTALLSETVFKGLARGLATMSLSDEYIRRRQDREERMREKRAAASGFREALNEGALIVRDSVSEGVVGLLAEPVQGGRDYGPMGFLGGIGKGVVGVAIKPVMGVLDAATVATQSVRSSAGPVAGVNGTSYGLAVEDVQARSLDEASRALRRRRRLPRALYGAGLRIAPYVEADAIAAARMRALHGGKLTSEVFAGRFQPSRGEEVEYIVTDQRLLCFSMQAGSKDEHQDTASSTSLPLWSVDFVDVQSITVTRDPSSGVHIRYGAGARWADLGPRVGVLVALVVFVFVPVALWPRLCSRVFQGAVAVGGLEWARAAAQSPAARAVAYGRASMQDWARLVFAMLALVAWTVPTMLSIESRIMGPCPGHRRSMETIAIVLLVSDSAQLGFGRAFGRTRFLPGISPNKSLEGYVGGLVVTIVYAWALHGWPPALTGPIFLAGVAGDLGFSLAKRIMGTKDFSGLLGPHGGICDRIDSYLGAWTLLSFISCDDK